MQTKRVFAGFEITAELKERIQAVAERKGEKFNLRVTFSDIVRQCLDAALPAIEREYPVPAAAAPQPPAPTRPKLGRRPHVA